jgi:glutaminyl-tRNA synthetase
VRLRHGYVIRCDDVVRDEHGEVVELICSYDSETKSRNPEGRRVAGTIHWVDAATAVPAEFRLYDRLFSDPDPGAGEGEFTERLNPESLVVRRGFVEASLHDDAAAADQGGETGGGPRLRYQFERLGYFCPDHRDSRPDAFVFNRIVTLKDSWSATGRRREEQVAAHEGRAREAPSAPSASVTAEPDSVRDPLAGLDERQKGKFARYHEEMGVDERDSLLLAGNDQLSNFFEAAVRRHGNPAGIANWIVNELLRELKDRSLEELPLTADGLAELVALIDQGTISARAGKDVFARMLATGDSPAAIVETLGLEQVSDEGEIEPLVVRLIAGNRDKARAYREGKTGLSGFFVGQVMRETDGRANPQLVKEIVERELGRVET